MADQIKEQKMTTDVLVVGGGTAGCLAAINARKQGAEVLVVEKGGSITRSGCLASGLDHYPITQAIEQFDDPRAFAESITHRGAGLYDRSVAEVYAREAKSVFRFLEDIGVPFKDSKTGQYRLVATLGRAKPDVYNFEGGRIKPIMAEAVKRSGARVLERVAIVGLLTRDQRVAGAVGFHIRDKDFFIISAKTVVIGTGGVSRLSPNLSGGYFIFHHPPYNTGDGHMMAFQAGAALTNMEFTVSSIEPVGFSAPGLSGYVGLGAHLINSLGERYMVKFHPLGERAPRNVVVNGTLKEYKEGRGPCYIDCRHLSREDVELVKLGLKHEKGILLDFFEAKGIDLSRDLLPVAPRELIVQGSGIMIDSRCQSTVEGLFAAGDCTNVGFAAPGAFTFGWMAGEEAGRAASKNSPQEVDPEQVENYRRSTFSPLFRPVGNKPGELEEEFRRIMKTCVGFDRSAVKLQEGIKTIKAIRQRAGDISVNGPHELLRALETRNVIDVGLLVAQAALERLESHAIPPSARTGFGEQDDKNWRGFVLLNRGDDAGARISFRPLSPVA